LGTGRAHRRSYNHTLLPLPKESEGYSSPAAGEKVPHTKRINLEENGIRFKLHTEDLNNGYSERQGGTTASDGKLAQSQDSGNNNNEVKLENSVDVTDVTPKTTVRTEREIMKHMADLGKVLINLTFPNKGNSKVEFIPSRTLRESLATQIYNRQYDLESLLAKDENGNILDWNLPLGELNLPTMAITLITKQEEAKPFFIYLPGGVSKELPWETCSNKDLRAALQIIFEAKPEYQNLVPTQPFNEDQKYTDLNIKLNQIPDRAICIGIDMAKWCEQKKND
jgi:hypothetical protein